MLIPRFSIRLVLGLTAVLAVLFLVVRQAFLGQQWAMAVAAILAFLLFVFATYALTFVAAYGLARTTRTLHPQRPNENPFVVDGEYPPQTVPRNPYGDQV